MGGGGAELESFMELFTNQIYHCVLPSHSYLMFERAYLPVCVLSFSEQCICGVV